MKEEILFSIGIPAFKPNYLSECISSVLNQTYSNFELIIINDFSPHPIEDIVFEYKDPRINYYRNEKNIGAENVVDNWNKCLEKANGQFFILMGDDDRMESNYLKEFIKLISFYPDLDIYHCRSLIINENSNITSVTQVNPEFEDIYDYMSCCLKEQREQFISDFVYRIDALRKNNGFYNLPLGWASDFLSAFIACGSKGIAHTNKFIFCYRRNSLNITSTGCIKLKYKARQIYFQEIESIVANEPDDLINKLKWVQVKYLIHEKKKLEKIYFIRQLFGKYGKVNGAKIIYKNRKLYKFSPYDILVSLVSAYLSRILFKTVNSKEMH